MQLHLIVLQIFILTSTVFAAGPLDVRGTKPGPALPRRSAKPRSLVEACQHYVCPQRDAQKNTLESSAASDDVLSCGYQNAATCSYNSTTGVPTESQADGSNCPSSAQCYTPVKRRYRRWDNLAAVEAKKEKRMVELGMAKTRPRD